MKHRCPKSQALSNAVLSGYRLVFPRPDSQWRGGVAGIEPDPKAHVEGALYGLCPSDIASLDTYEGIADGDYSHLNVTMELPDGRTVAAYTYRATPVGSRCFKPSPRYLATIIKGAMDHGLSASWIEFLKSHASRDEPAFTKRAEPPSTENKDRNTNIQ